jgi:hypothetical protein
MSDRQLVTLFDRPDVGLKQFRKQKFFETVGEEDYGRNNMSNAAIMHVVDFTNEAFAALLSKPDEQRVRILRDLSIMTQGLRLCLYEAIHDALFASEVSPIGADYVDAEFAKRTFEGKLKRLKGRQREKELLELKLYRLAVQAVPWKKSEQGYPPRGELAFLEEPIVEGDTWATFVVFCKKRDEGHFLTRRLGKHLPKIWEAGERDDPSLDEDDIQDADRLAGRVANRLADLLAAAHDEPEGEESKLAKAFGKLSVHATVAQEKTLEAVNSVKAELTELRRSHNRQRGLFWAVIGLLIVLLFVGR